MIKVILCDDHALIRRGIRDTLCDAPDIEVVGEAGDYGELRVLMRDTSADVLVLDVNLPGLDGFALCRKLREAGNEAPVIFLTARDDPADLREGFTGGGDDYLTKPFSLEELVLRVEALLRRGG